MKLPVATFLSAVLVASTVTYTSAAACTDGQIASIDTGEDPAFEKACPALFSGGASILDGADTSTFTKDLIASLSPCKSDSCTAYLTTLTNKSPDCELMGINIRTVYGSVLKLCKAFADGVVVSDDELQKIFGAVIGNATNLFEGPGSTANNNSKDKEEAGSTDKEAGSTDKEAGSANTDIMTIAPPTTKPDSNEDAVPAATNAVPAPAVTEAPKSGAAYLTGVAACATAAVVSALLL